MSVANGVSFNERRKPSYEKCCVEGCESRANKDLSIRFHRLPKPNAYFVQKENLFGKLEKIDLLDMWLKAAKIKKITPSLRVCSLHFKKEDYVLPDAAAMRRFLKRTAFPSCNLPGDSKIGKIKQINKERLQRRVSRSQKLKVFKTQEENMEGTDNEIICNKSNVQNNFGVIGKARIVDPQFPAGAFIKTVTSEPLVQYKEEQGNLVNDLKNNIQIVDPQFPAGVFIKTMSSKPLVQYKEVQRNTVEDLKNNAQNVAPQFPAEEFTKTTISKPLVQYKIVQGNTVKDLKNNAHYVAPQFSTGYEAFIKSVISKSLVQCKIVPINTVNDFKKNVHNATPQFPAEAFIKKVTSQPLLQHKEVQVNTDCFTPSIIKCIKTDSELSASTGIKSFEILNVIVEMIKKECGDKYEQLNVTMNTRDRVIMAYMMLKHNLSYSFLAVICHSYTPKHCQRIFFETIRILSKCLKEIATSSISNKISNRNIKNFKIVESVNTSMLKPISEEIFTVLRGTVNISSLNLSD